jgi:hypothetical protein
LEYVAMEPSIQSLDSSDQEYPSHLAPSLEADMREFGVEINRAEMGESELLGNRSAAKVSFITMDEQGPEPMRFRGSAQCLHGPRSDSLVRAITSNPVANLRRADIVHFKAALSDYAAIGLDREVPAVPSAAQPATRSTNTSK